MKNQNVSAAAPIQLERYRDRQRVVAAYLPAGAPAQAETFRKLWAISAAELKERDAVLLEIDDLGKQPEIARRLGFTTGKFALALVGKDGRVAWRADNPAAPRAVFDQIDAMPMRQREMRERGGANPKEGTR